MFKKAEKTEKYSQPFFIFLLKLKYGKRCEHAKIGFFTKNLKKKWNLESLEEFSYIKLTFLYNGNI